MNRYPWICITTFLVRMICSILDISRKLNSIAELQALLDHAENIEDLDTGSDQAFALVNHWLNSCRIKHEVCRSIQNTEATLPFRVIDVGSCDGSEEPCLRLGNGHTDNYI